MEQPSPTPREEPSLAEGCALIFLGLVVLVPSGLCTGYLAVDWNFITVPLFVGGPFVIGGAILLWFGARQLARYFRNWGED